MTLPNDLSPLWLSIWVVFWAILIDLLLGIHVAYWLTRRRSRLAVLVDALINLPLVLPPTVLGYYLIVLLGRRGVIGAGIYEWSGWTLLFTPEGAILASAIVALPLMVKPIQAAFESIDPELEEVALIYGCGRYRLLLWIYIPIAWHGIVSGIVLATARAMGEFGATLMVAGNIPGRTVTMPLAIYMATTAGDWNEASFWSLTLVSISLALVLLSRLALGNNETKKKRR